MNYNVVLQNGLVQLYVSELWHCGPLTSFPLSHLVDLDLKVLIYDLYDNRIKHIFRRTRA